MKLGEARNPEAAEWGRPLDGIRVLALEQMQALPFATQLMARLGAEVIKVEPLTGESARTSQPAAVDEKGQTVGATFLRYNLGKRSVAVDLKSDRGRQLVLDLATKVDVVCENLGPGRADRLGVGYDAMDAVNPRIVYLSVSGFGNSPESPYIDRPAYAAVAEAMSGIYEYARRPHQPPIINPSGGLGDTGTGMFGIIGVLAALRHRDRIGVGQHVDISMFDSMLSICDITTNYWSMGVRKNADEPTPQPLILEAFRAGNGWFYVQVGREHQFERLAKIIGRPEWLEDERFATRWGWSEHLEAVIRPALEGWAADKTKDDAASTLAASGITSAPCYSADEVVVDPHVAARAMLVEVPRYDGGEQPVLVAGNPVKLSKVAEGPEGGYPTLGGDTVAVLGELLGLDAGAIDDLRSEGVVAG